LSTTSSKGLKLLNIFLIIKFSSSYKNSFQSLRLYLIIKLLFYNRRVLVKFGSFCQLTEFLLDLKKIQGFINNRRHFLSLINHNINNNKFCLPYRRSCIVYRLTCINKYPSFLLLLPSSHYYNILLYSLVYQQILSSSQWTASAALSSVSLESLLITYNYKTNWFYQVRTPMRSCLKITSI